MATKEKEKKVVLKLEFENEQDADWVNAARLKSVYRKATDPETAKAAKKELDRMEKSKLYTFEELKKEK